MQNVERLAGIGETKIDSKLRTICEEVHRCSKCIESQRNGFLTYLLPYNRKNLLYHITEYKKTRETALQLGLEVSNYDSRIAESLILTGETQFPINSRDEKEFVYGEVA